MYFLEAKVLEKRWGEKRYLGQLGTLEYYEMKVKEYIEETESDLGLDSFRNSGLEDETPESTQPDLQGYQEVSKVDEDLQSKKELYFSGSDHNTKPYEFETIMEEDEEESSLIQDDPQLPDKGSEEITIV